MQIAGASPLGMEESTLALFLAGRGRIGLNVQDKKFKCPDSIYDYEVNYGYEGGIMWYTSSIGPLDILYGVIDFIGGIGMQFNLYAICGPLLPGRTLNHTICIYRYMTTGT